MWKVPHSAGIFEVRVSGSGDAVAAGCVPNHRNSAIADRLIALSMKSRSTASRSGNGKFTSFTKLTWTSVIRIRSKTFSSVRSAS